MVGHARREDGGSLIRIIRLVGQLQLWVRPRGRVRLMFSRGLLDSEVWPYVDTVRGARGIGEIFFGQGQKPGRESPCGGPGELPGGRSFQNFF